MESSNPSRAVAVIESQPWLTAPEGGQCMKFFYNMYGKTMGSLKVAIQKQGENAKVVFAKYGNQGMKWIAARVDLDIPQGKKYKVTSTGVSIKIKVTSRFEKGNRLYQQRLFISSFSRGFGGVLPQTILS